MHHRDHLRAPQRDALEHRAHEVLALRVEAEADPESGGRAVPVGAGEPRERRHEHDVALDRGGAAEGIQFARIGEQSDAADPVGRRVRVVYAAIEGVRGAGSDTRRDGREDPVVMAGGWRLAADREGECAGAERDLHVAGGVAAVAEQRGLLVGDAGGHGDAAIADRAEVVRRRQDRRQEVHRDAEEPAEFLVPGAGREIHEAGARGRRDVGRVASAEAVEEERVARREPQPLRAGEPAGVGHVVEQPAQLARREARIERQPGPCERQRLGAVTAHLLDGVARPDVVPDDRVVEGLAGLGVPDDDGPALVAEAHAGGAGRVVEALPQRREQFPRIVLEPARLRIELPVREPAQGDELAIVQELERPGGRGALVDADHEEGSAGHRGFGRLSCRWSAAVQNVRTERLTPN